MTEWSKTFVDWTEGNTAYLSVVFTWDLPKAYQRAIWWREQGYEVKAGGPACLLMPEYLADVADVNSGSVDALPRHNPDATFTSRGCIRKCKFCAVPKIEGSLVELDEWEAKPIVCDNNLLACSQDHFDKVIDSLKGIKEVDFNQGIDARVLTHYHAQRLAELDLAMVRLAWDNTAYGNGFMRGYERLRRAKIPKRLIRPYVLIGFKDKPDDAAFRLRTLRNMGLMPTIMRYQPLDALVRNKHIADGWTQREFVRFGEYWSRQLAYVTVDWDDFSPATQSKRQETIEGQIEMELQ